MIPQPLIINIGIGYRESSRKKCKNGNSPQTAKYWRGLATQAYTADKAWFDFSPALAHNMSW